MESRFWIFLLSALLLSAGCSSTTKKPLDSSQGNPVASGAAPASSQANPDKEIIQTDPVIEPDVKRREVKQADIDTENFEIGFYVGVISIEDFGSEPVYGLRLDYHITEDFFLEAAIGFSEAGTTSFERIGANTPLLTDEEREYTNYYIGIGYNLLPGEAFLGRNTAYNTALYLIAAAGTTKFAGDDRFTITWGAGYRIAMNDWMALHMDFRDHIYNFDVTGEDKNVNNLEATLGLTFFF